ncbi:amino acid adenylation domain [Herpetosiphon aurantiacus DSM 785]|uniref:Amino acid adenylation domain n=1 Tax=Herpetosiphon aurantiacus (strain ATCC 23779 / DSM 785 / 114-95) TaxID=316274 RepID=A9AV16_HERA2|nr:amino acid adenylation domain [Herpetosiphon aurantiacus DSM 785]
MYTKEELLKRRAQLSANQRTMLDKQLRGEAMLQADPGYAAIGKRPADAPTPLSFSQERLWFLQQLDPANAAFNGLRPMMIAGPLDIDLINRVAREMYRRHEILRTSFRLIDGAPCQIVDQDLPRTYAVPVIDLGHLPPGDAEAEARRLMAEEARTPFDMGQAPMMRLTLISLDAAEHALLLSLHHIAYDEWSNQVLVDEFSVLYRAFAQGQPSPLPELPIQYGDYAYWQREWLQGSVLEAQLAYWAEQLGGALPTLDLPTDHPRPAVQNFRLRTEQTLLPAELAAALRAMSQKEGVTLFMALLSAFKTLLFYYTNQPESIVGTFIAGRSRPELERLIGFFVNSLPLRSDLTGDPTFSEVLKQVRAVTLGAYNHQDVPIEKLIETFTPKRDLSRTAIYQAMFVLQNVPKPGDAAEPSALVIREWQDADASAGADLQCDITLMVYELPDGGLRCQFEYDSSLFEAATIQRMLAQFETLLAAVSSNPGQRLSRLSLLTDQERQQVLYDWNATAVPFAVDSCIHTLFESQAARAPQAIALVHGKERLTYGELNRRANQLSHYLRTSGVGSGGFVGLALERSVEMVVAVLGVLKAGAAYVPLDPTYPAARLQFMLADADVGFVLTTGRLRDRLAGTDRTLLEWEALGNLDAYPPDDPPARATAASPAYVIYTSGSTGQPKGVVVPHGALVQTYHTWESAYGLDGAVRCHLQMAAFSFDVCAGDLIRALGSGGTLVICPRDTLLAPADLHALIVAEGVDCAEFVPAVLRELVAYLEGSGGDLGSMRLLIAGSDTWYGEEYARVARLCGPDTRLVNSYGVTEAVIDSTYFEAGAAAELPARRQVPIGRPFAATRAYVLNRLGQPQPIGVPGELYLGGSRLALGYWRRPGLTAERFVPDPFAGEPGARMYRTGDAARFRADGTIEFLGRIDQQVKLHGVRIELGEIEAILLQQPGVIQAAAAIRENQLGHPILVAYLVTDALGDEAALRAALRERLPEHMVPAATIILPSLPLTPNGKIDRQALPEPDLGRSEMSAAYEAPGSLIEETLAEIWGEVLKREQVGIRDNFFELGGHSLLITQVIYRANEAFELNLPLRSLFEEPTIADFALRVEEALLDKLEQLDDEEAQQLIEGL